MFAKQEIVLNSLQLVVYGDGKDTFFRDIANWYDAHVPVKNPREMNAPTYRNESKKRTLVGR